MNSSNNNTEKIEERLESFGPNRAYVWELLQEYLRNPASVDRTWQEFFLGLVEETPHSLKKTPAQPVQARQEPQAPAPEARQQASPPPVDGKSVTRGRGAHRREHGGKSLAADGYVLPRHSGESP